MSTAIAPVPEEPEDRALVSAAPIKAQIDAFLEARRHILEKILPLMIKGVDYYDIKDKRSLGKPGAEKVAAIFRMVATFQVDKDTIALLPERKEWVAYVCTLRRDGEVVGEGRGAETLREAQGDPNKMVKMAEKSAHIDAVIRATGISDLFTQDIEDMPEFQERKAEPVQHAPAPVLAREPEPQATRETPSAVAQATAARRPGRTRKSEEPTIDGVPLGIAAELDRILKDPCIADLAEQHAKYRAKCRDAETAMRFKAFLGQVLNERRCCCDLPMAT